MGKNEIGQGIKHACEMRNLHKIFDRKHEGKTVHLKGNGVGFRMGLKN
jgi:hypothetical protein